MNISALAEIIRPAKHLACWDWTAAHVDFSLCSTYRAAVPGRYNPALMPWWRGPTDAITDRNVREVVVCAMEQCGKTEHCVCNPLRYWAATGEDLAVLYVGGAEERAQEIFEERIIRGFQCSEATATLAEKSRRRGQVYEIGGLTIVCGWSGGRDTFKGRPFDVVLADEVSSWADVSRIEQAKKRGATRPFFKLVTFSSPDANKTRESTQDPIFSELAESDAREWMVPDPKSGAPFCLDVGDVEGPGLKWDAAAKGEDGRWDLKAVAESAHYLTPGGARIDEAGRWPLVLRGQWQPTNGAGVPGKVGFHMGSFMLPWPDQGGWAAIAVRKVRAVSRGPDSHRVFRYQVEARPWVWDRSEVKDASISASVGQYDRGQLFAEAEAYRAKYAGRALRMFLTVDVQRFNFWWRLRLWAEGGDSGGIDYGSALTWDELAALADRWGDAHKDIPLIVLVDSGEGAKAIEIGEACALHRFVACKGSSAPVGVAGWRESAWNIYTGTSKANSQESIALILHWPHGFKTEIHHRLLKLSDCAWYTERGVGPDYVAQMTAQECGVDGKWVLKTGKRDDHLWACEELQLVGATMFGFSTRVMEGATHGGEAQQAGGDTEGA